MCCIRVDSAGMRFGYKWPKRADNFYSDKFGLQAIYIRQSNSAGRVATIGN